MSAGIEPVSAAGVTPLAPLSFESGADGAGASGSAGAFATSMTGAVENLQQLQSTSNELAVQAVTGDLQDIHQAMIASTRASVTLDLVVAVRDRSVSAFNEIMRMQA
ncbi:flagellar hook-basal body complex protein FliE [Microbacterium phyllosphaerae]|uniref:Flagellar hook-basal body complex protein FliE n=1 Tax=Microbacterium phyllosphaerae TaxID=124798 RepID=A0ABS4WS16_9MICO|nr:flagellar hook-basal body complex protein FliE [Microbacterium phyllosphaerae]MBP2378995.1 flagellar hook-basal body complex protein FliE [Microbacterium phyllosphaerae]MCS3444328.1 flagellar hook-basal body complex protein FliE [Microbacterium phyllosphaerae]